MCGSTATPHWLFFLPFSFHNGKNFISEFLLFFWTISQAIALVMLFLQSPVYFGLSVTQQFAQFYSANITILFCQHHNSFLQTAQFCCHWLKIGVLDSMNRHPPINAAAKTK
jgi:hypothetical protein